MDQGAGGELRGVPSSWWRGRTQRGNGCNAGSTAVTERTAGFGELWWSYLGARAGRETARECSAEGASEQGELGEQGVALKG
jgi:hypothetical protein